MDRATFLGVDDATVAAELRARSSPCWAIAMGGSRRGFIADGNVLAGLDDLRRYFQWSVTAQCAVLDRIYGLGVQTVVAVVRIPADRGVTYQGLAGEALAGLATDQTRQVLYARHHLRVSVAGDLHGLAEALAAPVLAHELAGLRLATASKDGPQLIYLFRGSWVEPGVEEAQLGYRLGRTLGRVPTRDELVRDFYGMDVPPLTVYVGSGRPQLGLLRPPFLAGAEDLYWAQTPLMRLQSQDWRQIIYDHLWVRRTKSSRTYAMDENSRQALSAVMAQTDGQIVGIGTQHPLGFWIAGDHAVASASDE